jgi:hypothetical protein
MVSSQLIGALIAVGLGFWAYSDAKALQRRGIRVGSFSPAAWGFGVALVAVLFGVLYLRQRSRAVRAAPSAPPGGRDQTPIAPPPPPAPPPSGDRPPPPDGRERDRFCGGCGHELPPYVASFCPKCGKPL